MRPPRQLNRMNPYPTSRAGDDNPFGRLQAGAFRERVIWRPDGVRDHAPFCKRDLSRQFHQIQRRDGRVLGICPGRVDADIAAEIGAQRLAAGETVATPSACQIQRAHHPVARRDVRDAPAHLRDLAGDFVTEDDRHLRGWELAVADGQVELVHGAGSDANECGVGTK
jgi:hypothetical protein